MFIWFFSVNGLLVTLIMGLIVGLASFYIQDMIQKQRYLELLELELRENIISGIDEVAPYQKSGVMVPPYYLYRTQVFESGLQSGYILSIDSSTLAQLFTQDTAFIPRVNMMIQQAQSAVDQYQIAWFQCLNERKSGSINIHCELEQKHYNDVIKNYSQTLGNIYVATDNSLAQIKFDPTQKRLSNPFMRFLMGSESLKVQE